MAKIKDDHYEVIYNDIEKIQMKPSQYIGALGKAAAMHLSKEVINNAIDEVISPNAVGKEVIIYLDEKENTLSVSDNSRGIPFDMIESVCTIIASSTKFTRENSADSAGENGTGQKAVNALSEFFEVTVTREGEKGKIRFEQGKVAKPMKIVKIKNVDEHGTTISFKPSEIFLGDDCQIVADDLRDWVEKEIYLIPRDVKITLIIDYIEKEGTFKKVYKNKNGLFDYVDLLADNKIIKPIMLNKRIQLKELVTNRRNNLKGKLGDRIEMDRFIGVQFAFTFSEGTQEMNLDSFCNFVNTFDGGVHQDAVKKAITDFFVKETAKTITKKDSADLTITARDVEQGLTMVCYLATNINPQFISQIKSKVGNGDLFSPVRILATECLEEYFGNNPKDLKKMCDFVKTNARGRLASIKARNSVIKEEKSDLSRFKNENLIPPNTLNLKSYNELIIVEGNSAGNEAARYDNDVQGLFKVRGYLMNTFNQPKDKILNNDEIRNLVSALGCNIGAAFNINKLLYDKIIILTDSDADGYEISSLICAFFVCHMPEIIKQGRLYKGISPLYRVRDKNNPYILSKREYIEAYEKNVAKSIILYDPKNGKALNKTEMMDFLYINRGYSETLNKLAKHYSIHPDIIEFLAINHDTKNVSKLINKKFPEISIDKNVLVGIYENRYQILVIDELFIKKLQPLIDAIKANKRSHYELVEKKNKDARTLMTVGRIMEVCSNYELAIEMRYKGLGELNANELKSTTMNPHNRMLIQITMDDAEKELERFNIFHGNNADARKEMFGTISLEKEYLDN